MGIRVSSTAFGQGEVIPDEYTCEGRDVSPPLTWSGAPEGTGAFALIMHDPDAPGGDYVHWVVYDLPPDTTSLDEGAKLPAGARAGVTDNGRDTYGGPCPPPGKPHRYYFRVYALDGPTGLEAGATRDDVLAAIEGHVLDQGELMGTYER